jgi:multiple sugar transport system substrate-binding protein
VAGKYDPSIPIYGLPWSLNCEVLWYRKDLISTPPKTWAEVREVAKTLTKNGMYGMAVSGTRLSDFFTVEYLPRLWSLGGELWDATNWKAEGVLNSPKSVAALQMMRDMVAVDKSVDPASGNWGLDERLAALLQGKAAMALNWVPLFGGIAEDPKSSTVVGKLAYAPSPAGEGGQFAMYGCQGTGINAFSNNKAAAWQYLQWLESKETQQKLVDEPSAGYVSARKDLKDYAAGKSEWQRVFVESIPMVRDMWNNSCYAELLDIMGREGNLAYIGQKTAEQALNDAAVAQQVVLDSCPENPKNKA